MRTGLQKFRAVFLMFFFFHLLFGQDLRLKQADLPYAIPIIEKPSQGEGMEYRWLENATAIANSNSIYYTVPKDQAVGVYAYISQVKCDGCSDWLNSNPFTIEILADDDIPDRDFSHFKVVFSPQKDLHGYLEELIKTIDNSQQTIDIAIYGMDDYLVFLALKRAVERNVQVRMLYEGALKDRNQANGTVSHKLEEIGIDVKYVNKTNHHKFIISDNRYLMTGSGNWNTRSNWTYNNSTLSVSEPEIILRYRAEFELLWNNSREFGRAYTYTPITPESLLDSITDNPHVDAVFTTSNYRVYNSSSGPTFGKVGNKQEVAKRVVELIHQAQSSIKISANYLRSRPISEALVEKKIQNPHITIQIITDQQQYITESYHNYQISVREECLHNASTPAQTRDCLEKNFIYSYHFILHGIEVRFKIYSYSWDVATAVLMHHKYAIFDDDTVAVGSYNYSYNSETNSMENLLIFNRIAAGNTVERFVHNFNEVWNLGRVENFYSDLIAHLHSSNRYVPLRYPSMTLTHAEYANLKGQTERASPPVTHAYFKNNRAYYAQYLKGNWLTYENELIHKIHDNVNRRFTMDYTYDDKNNLLSSTHRSFDTTDYLQSYTYNRRSYLTKVETPLQTVEFNYAGKELVSMKTGQGMYSWNSHNLPRNGLKIFYHPPHRTNYLITEWNAFKLPTSLMDANQRTIRWAYDENNNLKSSITPNRWIDFSISNDSLTAMSSDGEATDLRLLNLNNYSLKNTGTVATEVTYRTSELADKKQRLTIQIESTKVSPGKGKTVDLHYVLDPYGRVLAADGLLITRKPYSGEIVSISKGSIQENRLYDNWGLLTEQNVSYKNTPLYKVVYGYDGMQRIKHARETINGRTTATTYLYNAQGQLETVSENGIRKEQYTYDDFGNRTNALLNTMDYTYINNPFNQTVNYANGIDEKEFSYTQAGQLASLISKTGGNLNSDKRWSYDIYGNLNSVHWSRYDLDMTYDAFDRLIATYLNGVVKQKLVYGINSLPIAELNPRNRILKTFVYADNQTPILMKRKEIDHYIISDIRGSVKMVIRLHDGAIIQQLAYDAFGNVIVDTHPGYTPFGYAGGLYDNRIRLVRFGARDYLPELGKWTSEDPIGFLSGGFNDYAYVLNDPINYMDPSGLEGIHIGETGWGKGYTSFGAFRNALGPAGKGKAWRPIVEQYKAHGGGFGRKTIQHSADRIEVDYSNGGIHRKLRDYHFYNTQFYQPKTVRGWLSTKRFHYHYTYGIKKILEYEGW